MSNAFKKDGAKQDDIKIDYIKQIDENFSISLGYLNVKDNERDCVLTFHNTLDTKITVNPKQNKPSKGWFDGIFGAKENQHEYHTVGDENQKGDLKLFLGYVQIVGYVVLNYKIEADHKFSNEDNESSAWWSNEDFALQYEAAEEIDQEARETNLSNVSFIRENLTDRMIVGGKLGGISDLNIKEIQDQGHLVSKQEGPGINIHNRYLLQDMLYPFNSIKTPISPPRIEDEELTFNNTILSFRDIMNALIPFYSTSQFLLFSDLSIPPRSSQSFKLSLPITEGLPPSYNTGLSRPICDQGWVSIKYLLLTGVLRFKENNLMTLNLVYFPLELKSPPVGSNFRFLQPDYLKKIVVDHEWKALVIEDSLKREEQTRNTLSSEKNHDEEAQKSFIEDLTRLINSDLHNIPDSSATERGKGSESIHELSAEIPAGLIPQLPLHLKTQFQINVNKAKLCDVFVSKPYYHVEDDVNFFIESAGSDLSTRIVGFVVYVECVETFHVKSTSGEMRDYTNRYKVTPNVKCNTFANALLQHHTNGSSTVLASGALNLPKYLCQQFQSSLFMDISYKLAFKFILGDFSTNEDNEAESNTSNADVTINTNSLSNSRVPSSVNLANGHNEEDVAESLLSESPHSPVGKTSHFELIKAFRTGTYGSLLKFLLPLCILP